MRKKIKPPKDVKINRNSSLMKEFINKVNYVDMDFRRQGRKLKLPRR